MALTVVFVLLGAAVYTFAYWLTLILGLFAIASIAMYLAEALPRRDRYSLASLREFEEKQTVRELYENLEKVPRDADTAVCPRCLEPYPS